MFSASQFAVSVHVSYPERGRLEKDDKALKGRRLL